MTTTLTPPAIDVRGLTRRFGDRPAVHGLDLRVPAGRVCGFVGPNGAGKTTTIRLLLGLLTPSAGEGTVLGEPLAQPARYLPRVGALIEAPAFYPALSGRDNLRVLARLSGRDERAVDEPLARVGLTARAADRYRSYSLGMKQRLGIAAALLGRPELVILDEPTNGLDPAGIREMRALFAELAAEGTTLLVSSHLLSEVAAVSHHVIVLAGGVLRWAGPLSSLSHGEGRISARPEDPGMLPALAALATAAGNPARIAGDVVEVDAPAAWAAELNRRAMAGGISLAALEPRAPDLEEAFFALTAGDDD